MTTAIDLRGKLPYNRVNAAKSLVKRIPKRITYDFVHYSALFCDPNATEQQEVAQLIGFANFHIGKDWSINHSGVYGWTIMYHWAIAPSGRLYILNNVEDITWSTTNGNPYGVATVLLLGPGQQPTQAMLATLHDHLAANEADATMSIVRERTFGHGECAHVYGGGPDFGNDTDCPGAALDWVRAYRASGTPPPPPPPPAPQPANRFFKETGHYISHGFKDEWEKLEAIPYSGSSIAMALVGYPITEEYTETIGGWTGVVQYFERDRFEYHAELTPPQVLHGRLGVENLAYQAQRGIEVNSNH